MVRTKANLLLVVAAEATLIPLPGNKQIIYMTELARLFPAIHEMQPGGLVLDHDHLGKETEKILRRMAFNPFYSKMKIYCYKAKPHTKVDALLKVLGVQEFIYAATIQQKHKSNPIRILNQLFRLKIPGKLVDAGY